MANGYVKAAQIIADDQTQVATKLQTLMDAEGIDAGELGNLEITTFGANKFLIAITYSALRSVGNLATKFGLTALAPKVKHGATITLTTVMGIKLAFGDLFKFFRTLTTTVGLSPAFWFKVGTKLNTTVGLLTVAPSHSSPFINRALGTTVGLLASVSSVWHDVAQSDSLSTSTGLKVSGQAFYNGVLPNIPIE